VKEPDHPFVKKEEEAVADGERQLARAWEKRKISESMTIAKVKEAMWLCESVDEPGHYFEPSWFQLNWILMC
jgi:hypothetical protein